MLRFSAAILITLGLLCDAAWAQELRVYTTVSRGEANSQLTEIGHSLTLFHNGKVYDFMEEVGEVVIYEPMNNRFIFMDGNYRASELKVEELRQFLKVAKSETQKYLGQLEQDGSPLAMKQANAIRFETAPTFQEKYEPAKQRLLLSSDLIRYDVTTTEGKDPQVVEKYLAYSDWFAKLNHILHSQSSSPEPRVVLNAALRTRGRLPLKVDRLMRIDGEVRLQAEHQYGWELQSTDQRHITKWEAQIESKDVMWVSFRDYQKKLLTSR